MIGATQASCRALFSELLPAGSESEFFGLYEITDKGSAWIGPLCVAAIRNGTGKLYYCFYFLLGFLALPSLFFWWIDEVKGKVECKRFNQVHIGAKDDGC